MPEFTVGDQRLTYHVHGDGVPLVTLTNLAAPPELWPGLYVGRMNQAGYRVIGVQHDGPTRSLERVIDDMGALIDHLDLGPVHIWGYSQGGMFAQELALARPDIVRSAVLMATVARKSAFMRISMDVYKRMRAIRATDPETQQIVNRFVSLMSFSPAALANDSFVELMSSFATDPSNYSEEASDRAMAVWEGCEDPLRRLADVRVPCLVIGFEIDLLALAAGCREVADTIPGARYVEIAGAPHSGIATHTDEVFEHVLSFFEQTSTDAPAAVAEERA